MSFSHTVSELMPPNRQRSYKVNLHAPGGGHSTAHKSLAGTLGIPELMPPEWRQTFKVREESL